MVGVPWVPPTIQTWLGGYPGYPPHHPISGLGEEGGTPLTRPGMGTPPPPPRPDLGWCIIVLSSGLQKVSKVNYILRFSVTDDVHQCLMTYLHSNTSWLHSFSMSHQKVMFMVLPQLSCVCFSVATRISMFIINVSGTISIYMTLH